MNQPQTATVAGLIVEDDWVIRALTADYLRDSFQIFEANDADEAIRLLEEHPEIRFVFTDVDLPGSLDGLKLAHYVRGRWPPVKLIVTSGMAKITDSDLPEGGVFFAKPYNVAHIAAKATEMTGAAI